MSYSCTKHGWNHLQSPCPYCYTEILASTASSIEASAAKAALEDRDKMHKQHIQQYKASNLRLQAEVADLKLRLKENLDEWTECVKRESLLRDDWLAAREEIKQLKAEVERLKNLLKKADRLLKLKEGSLETMKQYEIETLENILDEE